MPPSVLIKNIPVMGATRLCDLVQVDESGVRWTMETSDGTCLGPGIPPYGIDMVLLEHTKVEFSATEPRAFLHWGGVRVSTSAQPCEIENMGHVVDPDSVVKIALQEMTADSERLMVVESVLGESAVLTCWGDLAKCRNRHTFVVPQGEVLAVQENGEWYARRNPAGVWSHNQNPKTGCSSGKSESGLLIGVVGLLPLIITCRRRRKRQP